MTLADSREAGRYSLECRTAAGERVRLAYGPYTGELTDAAGTPLLADAQPAAFADARAVSPEAPGRKSRAVRTLKIQLGLRCNYRCTYCNQSGFAAEATVSTSVDAGEFLARLPEWLEGAPERVEFWGGEPLVYFAKLRRLVPVLRQRFPNAVFFLVTNGSLLDAEVLDFIARWDLFVAVSHDGPGQHLRGPDPFDDPDRAHWLRELWRRRGAGHGDRVTFNVVLTPANADIRATRAWLAERVGADDVALDTEGPVTVYGDRALAAGGRWTEREYAVLHASIVAGFVDGQALRYLRIRSRARDFVEALRERRPARALGQKCGMDRPDELAVDLHGRVMTCQNTGAQGRHDLGSVLGMDQVRLDTSTHWSHRECCTHCPVVQLCKGGCMFLHGEHFAQSCENEYRFNLAILAGVLRSVTGLELVHVTGDIRRPPRRRTIPISSLAVPA